VREGEASPVPVVSRPAEDALETIVKEILTGQPCDLMEC
jgi:hypothetical protein